MNKTKFNYWKAFLVVFGLLTVVTSVDAQPFSYQYGDLCLGFRKTGNYQGLYEIVVDLGAATNYTKLTAGTTINITQYSASQIDPDTYNNLTNLTWSVTGDTAYDTTFPAYPINTIWATIPRVNGVPGPVPVRSSSSSQSGAASQIESIWLGAEAISSMLTSNKDNTAIFVQEPYSIADGQNYGAFIADPTYPTTIGDLQGAGPQGNSGSPLNLENTTVAPFSTAVQSDLYQMVPNGSTDPNTLTTSGNGYNVGYFQLNPNGTMTFTRATTTFAAPVAGFTGAPTNGSVPLAVVFTDASTGTITNWLWNLGDGHTVTNTTSASVNHTYTNSGSFTVSLKVTGPGGANTNTRASYIVVSASSSIPKFNSVIRSSGKFIFSGTNGPASAQFRVLSTTNLALAIASWAPVYTNTILSNGSFAYTNSSPTNKAAFYRLVSP